MRKWHRDGFGLKGNHAHDFVPLANAEGTDADVDSSRAHPVWAHARRAAATGECPSLLEIKVPSGGLAGENLRVVLAKKATLSADTAAADRADRTPDATAIHHDHCALLALAYLAAQPEVSTCEYCYMPDTRVRALFCLRDVSFLCTPVSPFVPA